MKVIAAGAAVVLIILGFLLWEVTHDDPPQPAGDPARGGSATRTAAGAGPSIASATADARPADGDEPDAVPGGVFKLRSDPFWDRVDEYPRNRLLGFVADCYKGGKDRKAKLKVTYRLSISNHVVTMKDIKVVESTLGDQTLQDCMIRSLETAHFIDNEMPDFESPDNDPEDLLVRIEALKRFYPEQKDGMK